MTLLKAAQDTGIDSVRVYFTCCRWGFHWLGVMFAVSIVHQYGRLSQGTHTCHKLFTLNHARSVWWSLWPTCINTKEMWTRENRRRSIKNQMLRKCSYIISFLCFFFFKSRYKQNSMSVMSFERCFLKRAFTGSGRSISWNFQDLASGLSKNPPFVFSLH